MPFGKSLRGQLLARVIAILALLLLLLGISQYHLLRRYLERRTADGFRQQVRTAMLAMQPAYGAGDAQALIRLLAAPNTSVLVLDENRNHLAASGPAAQYLVPLSARATIDAPPPRDGGGGRRTPHPQPELQVQSVGNERWLVAEMMPPRSPAAGAGTPALVLVGQSLAEQDASLRFFIWLTVIGSSVGLLLAVVASWHLMGAALMPLTRLVEAAGAIAGGDWKRRVMPGGSKEIDDAAEAFNRMVDRLQVSFDEERAQHERMRRFLADAAHELRTPLTAMNGFVEIMQVGAVGDPGTQKRALDAMRGEGERMARLIRDLLRLARLDNPDRGALNMEQLDLGEVLEGLHPALAASDPLHHVELHVEGKTPILGNVDGLIQVVWNLVDNARRYSKEGSTVKISCRSTGTHALLTVSDQGIGISPEDIGKVFDRFWRGDASRQRETGGTGLGLSIVKALVDAHGGQISVQSEVGTGTTFEIRFPLHKQ